MRIGLLGTGTLSQELGRAWKGAGHSVTVTGRDRDRAAIAAERFGGAVAAPADLPGSVDALVLAVSWDGLVPALSLVGGAAALRDLAVIDCTNAVDFGTGRLLVESGSAAELVARTAPGARVVKALHLFAGATWPYTGPSESAPVVALCGDDTLAVSRARSLVEDLGARAAHIGGLDAARQAEEAAGFVMRLVAAGTNPRLAVPDVSPRT